MKIINLLPKDQQKQLQLDVMTGQVRIFWIWVLTSLLVFLALGVGAQQYLRIKVSSLEKDITKSKAELQTSDSIALQKQVLALNNDIKEVITARNQQYKWSEVLLELARIMPASAQLTGLQMERATAQVVILGKAKNRDSVLEVWAELKKSKLFYDVNFPLPNLEQPTDSSFTFTFYVNLDLIKANDFEN